LLDEKVEEDFQNNVEIENLLETIKENKRSVFNKLKNKRKTKFSSFYST